MWVEVYVKALWPIHGGRCMVLVQDMVEQEINIHVNVTLFGDESFGEVSCRGLWEVPSISKLNSVRTESYSTSVRELRRGHGLWVLLDTLRAGH